MIQIEPALPHDVLQVQACRFERAPGAVAFIGPQRRASSRRRCRIEQTSPSVR